MTRVISRAVAATAMAIALLGGSAGAAHAAGGAVQGDIAPAACTSAGGGTWCYGTAASGVWKLCYSDYVHPDNYHSSTASMGGGVSKRYANAGYWSQARVEAGWAHTCYTYYDPDA